MEEVQERKIAVLNSMLWRTSESIIFLLHSLAGPSSGITCTIQSRSYSGFTWKAAGCRQQTYYTMSPYSQLLLFFCTKSRM